MSSRPRVVVAMSAQTFQNNDSRGTYDRERCSIDGERFSADFSKVFSRLSSKIDELMWKCEGRASSDVKE